MKMRKWVMFAGLISAAVLCGCGNKETMRWKE